MDFIIVLSESVQSLTSLGPREQGIPDGKPDSTLLRNGKVGLNP